MLFLQATSFLAYFCFLRGFILMVQAGDPSQQHPITASSPPKCASVPHSRNDCNMTSDSISQCTYRHCHIQFPTGCTDWWLVLDLNCICAPLGTSSCTRICPQDLAWTSYLVWLQKTCTIVPGWTGISSSTYIPIPSTAQILATDLHIQAPRCISSQDTQLFDECKMSTFDVSVLPKAPTLSIDTSRPWQLDQKCFCGRDSFSDIMNRSTCADDATEHSKALLWINAYCGTYGNYSQAQLTDWRNALFGTDLKIRPSSCISSQDTQALSNCVMDTSDVSGLSKGLSKPYQLDRDCFCGRFSFSDIMNRSTCAGNAAGYSKALLWINAYCGTYGNYSGVRLTDWRNALFATNLDTQPPLCISSQDTQALSACSMVTSDVSSLSEGLSKLYQLDRDCFCGQLSFSGIMNRSTCTEGSVGYSQALLYMATYCGTYRDFSEEEMPSGWMNTLLLPWIEQTHQSRLVLNNGSISPTNHDRACPTANEKLVSFAVVNILMAVLVPILGRRTVVNKITFGYLGHTNSRFWLFTGLIGVALHLSSNAVNAVIIRKVPGYENVSITHLVFLWCTRPRLAWLVVACVPFQAKKAMYFSVTASTLITEFVLQIFAAAYMGSATNYGRLMSFYKTSFLQDKGGLQGHEARIMYAGCLLWLIVFPFALMVCAWSVFGISSHLRSLSTYLVGMEASVRKQNKVASEETTRLLALINDESLGQDDTRDGIIHQHSQYLLTQSNTLSQEWRALQASCTPIPLEIRRDRRERNREIKAREADENWNYDLENFDGPWFLDPPRRANESTAHATRIAANVVLVERQHSTLRQQIHQKEQDLATMRQRSKILRQQIDELYATANLINIQRSRSVFARLEFNRTHRPDWSAVSQLSPDDQRRLQNIEQHHSSKESQIQHLNAMKYRQVEIDAIYTQVEQSLSRLVSSHQDIADCWRKVEKDRIAEAEAERRRNTFVAIPMVVLTGMLITWIAQWLWWGGYVHVAQDAYCPPKLVTLTAVWTLFSASSAAVGAST